MQQLQIKELLQPSQVHNLQVQRSDNQIGLKTVCRRPQSRSAVCLGSCQMPVAKLKRGDSGGHLKK